MHKEELEEGEIELDEVQPVTFKPPLPPMPPPQPPRPISPPPELPIPRTESSSNDVLSKPIKRREVLEEEQGEERDERTNVEDSDVYANFSPNRNVKDFEREARNDLISFLQKKSLDASWADYYSINVRPQKKRKDPNRKSEGLGYSVTYTNPEGTFLASKGDVLSDIQDRMKKSSLRNALGSSARTAAFEEAAHKVKNLILPFWLDNIYLLELGKIDTRSGFHSSVYIYPIGYKCEQTVIGTTLHKGVTEQDIICEIGDLDGFPEFRITVKSTGTVFCGFSEAAVWRKFNPGNVDVDWNPSFFNLQVELLIEGLEGSLQCEEYKFHIERGYNQTYFTEENAKIARKDFLTKAARERRNQDRQKNKHLSKEQQERQLELQRRTLEEEKEFSKKLKVVEKERKDRGKEEAIKKKEEKKVTEAKRREEAKQQEIQSKEKLRAAERQHREQIKKNEKAKQQLRKDIFNEIRKNRSDANSSVLQFFDNEEENILQSENESHLYNDSNNGISSKEDGNLSNDADLRGFILNQDPLPDIPDQPNALLDSTVSSFSKGSRFHSGLSWDDIFYIANTVFLLKPMLGLGRGLNFDELLTGLEILVSPNSSFPSVETKDDTAMDIEQEFDSGSSSKSSTFLQRKALIEIEKLELFITKILLRDLSTLLDLDQREAADKRQAIPQTLYFPLNQMTWMEIVRMSLLNYLYTQFERSKDDIQHALRGSKQPSYRIAKNIVRNIRYRWYLRHKLHPTKRVKEIFDPSSLLARLVDSKKSTDEAKGGEAKAVIYIQPEDRLSIMQGIQYLATARTDEGGSADLLEFSLYTKALNELNTERKLSRPLQNIFNSEEEIDYELKKMANDATQSDIYRRCCKVMIRVLSLNASKNFLWEIDQEMYPDYYSIIIRPLMFANVATNVITKAYETSNATDERVAYYHIANEFLQDLRQVCLNCIVFSTELPLVVAQAQKLLLTIHRLVDRWIFSTSRPELAECDEGFCLLTNYPLQGNNRGEMIKCGKCQGTFSLTGLDEVLTLDSSADEVMAKQFTDFYIPPTTEVLSQVNEEWHCPLCLREDFIFTQSLYLQQREGNEGDAIAAVLSLSKNGAHTVDEWGPCGLIPWYFDTNHCNGVNEMTKKQPHLLPVIDALKVLSQSSVIPTTGNIANTAINSSIASSSTWTVAERIKLLSALCTVIHSTSKVTTYMSKLHNDSEKLLKLCANKHFREGDFFATVKSICGEDDAMYCRSRLDSMMSNMNTGSSHFSPTEVISESFRLQNMVTEGRCLVCNVTTFDDEIALEEGEDNENPQGSKVILCDGCNAEAHLKCLNLTTVPSNAWYCSRCSERQAKISKSDTSNAFDNIDSFRDKEEEDGLIDLCANEKVNGKDPFTANQDEIQCIYCGMNEREICSPLVIGQTRTEHDAWIEMYGKERQLVADNFYRVNGQSQKNTVVNFLFAEKTITPPKLTPPYYPPLQTAEGKTLMNYYENIQQTPIVAHQLCCLQLFQARLNRSRHALRRRRKDVASLALLKSGISTQSLGKDHYGYEYWKFPFTLDLFITHFNVDGSSAMVVLDPDREEFNRLIGKVTTSSSASQGTRKKWYRIGNSDGIRSIVELLDDSREAERTLKQNLIQFLLNERILIEKKPTLTKVDSHGTYDGGSLMDVAESKDGESGDHAEPIGNDSSEIKESYSTGKPGRKSLESSSTANTPVSIRLFPNKGQELVTFYSIPEEKVFDDSLPTDDTEEAGNEGDDPDSDNYHQYFSFSTKKYFAIGLVNSSEGLVKVANFNNDYKVVYQIHREGISQPISYAYLSEAWSDHFYYFATINFKRSGKYTISFLLEGGTNAGSIKPLIYSVTVEAKSVKSGIPNALDHLSASQYLDSNSRQIVSSKRELHQYLRNLQITLSSITIASKYQTNDAAMAVAIKILLIKVFLALPQGSLSSETTYASSFSVDEASDELLSSHLLEPSSWNYLLEHAWKDALVKAQCPTALMECLLLLEFYINRSWYSNYYSRLLNALPNPHFAIRTCTYASVALRVFCLDRAILYDKIQTAPRERRSTGNSNNHSNDYETRESYSGRGENTRSSRYAQRKQQEGTPPQASGGRSRRNAAVAASAKLKDIDSDAEEGAQKRISRQASEDSNYRQNDDDEDASDSGEEDEDDSNLVDEEEEEEEEEEERKGSSTRADGWKCKFCATKNEARARSCVSCGEKKPIPGVSNRERGGKTRGKKRKVSGKASGGRGRKKRRMSKRSSYSDEEDEEEAEEDDGSDDDDDEDNSDDEDNYKKPQRQTRASTVARTRGRGRPPKSYSEDSDEVEEEVEGESDEDEYKYRKQSKKRKSNDEDEEEEDEQAESEDDDEEEKDDEGEEEEDGENGDAQNNNHEDFIDQKTQAIETKISEWKASPSLQNDMNIRFASILRQYLTNESFEVFWYPVNTELEPSYSSYIKEPMDLGTILQKVFNNAYATDVEKFRYDINLVWSNCMTYNLESSELYSLAEEAVNTTEDFINRWITSSEHPEDPDIQE